MHSVPTATRGAIRPSEAYVALFFGFSVAFRSPMQLFGGLILRLSLEPVYEIDGAEGVWPALSSAIDGCRDPSCSLASVAVVVSVH